MLENADDFATVFRCMTKWIKSRVQWLNKKRKLSDDKYYQVLCAHGGFNFDYPILLHNMAKHNTDLKYLKYCQLHFADTFKFCEKFKWKCRGTRGHQIVNGCPLQPFFPWGKVCWSPKIFTGPLGRYFGAIEHESHKKFCTRYELMRQKNPEKVATWS